MLIRMFIRIWKGRMVKGRMEGRMLIRDVCL